MDRVTGIERFSAFLIVGAAVFGASAVQETSFALGEATARACSCGRPHSPAEHQPANDRPDIRFFADGRLEVDGQMFKDVEHYIASRVGVGARCGTPTTIPEGGISGASDCPADANNPLEVYAYDPSSDPIYEIPVVFHVLMTDDASLGYVSPESIREQISVLNEGFAGAQGGVDTGIRFRLASIDPDCSCTSGIEYHSDTAAFLDVNPAAYTALYSWDTERYLNIYSNVPLGAGGQVLGYVPEFPQVIAGGAEDRMVLFFEVVGLTSFTPYHLGKTATHEIGHYLGLYHTFQDGCPDGEPCREQGDLICDTPPEPFPNFGCPVVAPEGCPGGDPAPYRNYMNYSDDPCLTQFTSEQTRRMRCAIMTYRASLASEIAPTMPSQLEASDDGSLGVSLTWTLPILAANSFTVQRSNDGLEDWTTLATGLDGEVSTYFDSTTTPGTRYRYRVQALGAGGETSDWVEDCGSQAALGPVSLSASDGSFADRVELEWTIFEGATPSPCYRIFRSTLGGPSIWIDQTDQLRYVDEGIYLNSDPSRPLPGAPVPSVLYQYDVKGVIDPADCETLSVDAGLTEGVSDNGYVGISPIQNFTTTGGPGSSQPALSDRVLLRWSYPGTVFQKLYIYRSADGRPFEEIAILDNTQRTNWSDFQVKSNLRYDYFIRGFSNLLGLSTPSVTLPGVALEVPTLTSATENIGSRVRVTWQRPQTWQPSVYRVWRKLAGRDPWPALPLAEVSSAQLFFNDTSVEHGLVYVYAVDAYSIENEVWSDRGRPLQGYPEVLPPTGLTASDGQFLGHVRLDLTPTGAQSGVKWRVYRRKSGTVAPFTLIAETAIPLFLDLPAVPGVVYEYAVTTLTLTGI